MSAETHSAEFNNIMEDKVLFVGQRLFPTPNVIYISVAPQLK